MDSFPLPLRIEKLGERTWILTDALLFQTDRLKGTVIVPRGFQTDLASIPRILWATLPPIGYYDKAAVVHDAGYGSALMSSNGSRIHLVKSLCDLLFLDGMISEGVQPTLARVMHFAVSHFGSLDSHPLHLSAP